MSTLKESGLSRIKSKLDTHAVGAITAFRGEFTKKENKQRNKKLLAQIMRLKFQVTTVKGSYIENYGETSAREVGETSFFVVNPLDGDDKGQLEKALVKLGKEYDQDSILSKRLGKPAELIGTNKSEFPGNGKRVPVGTAAYGKAGEFFSRVNGRPFAFESAPETLFGKMALKIIAESNWHDIEV